MRSVVVTGTSTGIGWGTTKVLIARGFRVFGSVRKKADAERLSAEFGAAFALPSPGRCWNYRSTNFATRSTSISPAS
jgi:NAD(P)-dependent dehydrogenase (short-subunit alcohol dehydrogenase family)